MSNSLRKNSYKNDIQNENQINQDINIPSFKDNNIKALPPNDNFFDEIMKELENNKIQNKAKENNIEINFEENLKDFKISKSPKNSDKKAAEYPVVSLMYLPSSSVTLLAVRFQLLS